MNKIFLLFAAVVPLTAAAQSRPNIIWDHSYQTITINAKPNDIVAQKAKRDLIEYLPTIYEDIDFVTVNTNADITLDIDVEMSSDSYRVNVQGDRLFITSGNSRGLLYGVYSLLENLGYGFYLSMESAPEPAKWSGFDGWELEDTPIAEERIIFNWHNFISGCTGWNLKEWKEWIEGASRMRYNGIMVHAYGNNPMSSFDYLGQTKTTGYINNTASGRDWGNQHINDVRRIVGGEMFESAVYGAEASFATEENKVQKATELMQGAFSYADSCGMDVIFALDLDTWMANPQNIIAKIPKESTLNIHGHLAPNPDTEDGYQYYKELLKSLLQNYPQIDELTAWSRKAISAYNPAMGTMWIVYDYDTFPKEWQREYDSIMCQHPEIANDLRANGLFAFSKIIKALRRAAKELNSGIRIGYGSWTMDWMAIMDIFTPEDVPFRPLDFDIEFDQLRYDKYIKDVAAKRSIYPIVWAHHDDYAYIGRPFVPYKNLSDMVIERDLKGIGVIHWTTHPLDLYFKGTGVQLWQSGKNRDYQSVITQFVEDKFGEASPELINYYNEWAVNGPIFARETSDHVCNLGKEHFKSRVQSWAEEVEKSKMRIEMIEKTPERLRTNYWHYQRAMEEFYISFFENQNLFTD